MLKIEKTEVVGWKAAVRGMRNPMNSWEKSDSAIVNDGGLENSDIIVEKNGNEYFVVGEKDQELATGLRNAGTDHRKFMRMLIVSLDITAPLYWWKEYDTYKVGTVANSCSTMHTIEKKEFTRDDFSCEYLCGDDCVPDHEYQSSTYVLDMVIQSLNFWRNEYLYGTESGIPKDKRWWWQMIQLLPSSYNQKRTVMLSYEVLANIYKSRKRHKLDEWHTFCDWIKTLPYSELITGGADYLNKKLTIPESDAIIARALSKLQSSDSPDKSKAVLMELYEQLKKVEASVPPKDFKIIDEWNQYGRVDCIQSVTSNSEIATDTIDKLKKKFWSQEKGDTSDAKPE